MRFRGAERRGIRPTIEVDDCPALAIQSLEFTTAVSELEPRRASGLQSGSNRVGPSKEDVASDTRKRCRASGQVRGVRGRTL